MSAGVRVATPPVESDVGVPGVENTDQMETSMSSGCSSAKKQRKSAINETEETINLSNHELQRLVLMEQLTVLRLKKEKLLWEKNQREELQNAPLCFNM